LNDLYVRFFRMAERRIAEKTRQGVVCFISNYSWLDGLSFTGMRERYLEAFDAVRIDCLNGDKYKTGKVAPDGSPDPSIFSTESDPVGIQVGTAIATLVRKANHKPAGAVGFRHLWGQAKPEELTATAEAAPDALYEEVKPVLPLGLPFVGTAVSAGWFDWPSLPELFPVSFPGVKTSRDGFLVDVDLDRLRARVDDYFDASLSHEEIERRYPAAMNTTARFDAPAVRDARLKRGGPDESGFIRFAYRPFDYRWLYWDGEGNLLDRPRAEYRPHVFAGNLWLSAAPHLRKSAEEPQSCFSTHMSSLHLIERGATMFPARLLDHGISGEGSRPLQPNLTPTAQRYLDDLGLGPEDLFHHTLAVLHDPTYRKTNAGALRMEWPRIPLSGYPNGGDERAAETMRRSAAHGRELAALLDPETPIPGVTQAPLRPEIAAIAVPGTAHGRNMAGEDFAITAGWGRHGQGDAVMPGQGNAVERTFTSEERAAMSDSVRQLGETTFDVHLNANAFWHNVPAAVWHYTLGGYQVLKKWLSYREQSILQRPSRPEEVQQFAEIARRIAAILMITTQRS
ncbi:MAG: DNA methyltransferase, partial [Gammaproteobacteria bacterium]|nr:DNA methyltransferase [Gammaproteobacteria bacterium]